MIILLIRQIAQLFLCILAGFILARSGLIRGKDSRTLSVLALYLVNPCMIFSSFQIDYSDKVRDGLLLGLLLAVLIHILLLLANSAVGRALHLSSLERMSVMYSNAGNLIIPIVLSLFGQEYVIYSSAFVVVQTVLLWTHARICISGEKKVDIKKIVSNVNMIAIFLGLLTFVTQLPIPQVVTSAASSIGAMIGPLCMIIAGTLVGELNFKGLRSYKRLPLVVVLRLIVFPLLVVCLLRIVKAQLGLAGFDDIYVISLLAAITPTAATITQQCQVYNQDSVYSNAIYLITTLLCIFTMPVMLQIFLL